MATTRDAGIGQKRPSWPSNSHGDGAPLFASEPMFQTFNMSLKDQTRLVDKISDAVADVTPNVSRAIKEVPGFRDIGRRMLLAWNEGV